LANKNLSQIREKMIMLSDREISFLRKVSNQSGGSLFFIPYNQQQHSMSAEEYGLLPRLVAMGYLKHEIWFFNEMSKSLFRDVSHRMRNHQPDTHFEGCRITEVGREYLRR